MAEHEEPSARLFSDDLARDLEDPEFLREYVREQVRGSIRIAATGQIMNVLDDAREAAALSKGCAGKGDQP